jgi:hypothetical protein
MGGLVLVVQLDTNRATRLTIAKDVKIFLFIDFSFKWVLILFFLLIKTY